MPELPTEDGLSQWLIKGQEPYCGSGSDCEGEGEGEQDEDEETGAQDHEAFGCEDDSEDYENLSEHTVS